MVVLHNGMMCVMPVYGSVAPLCYGLACSLAVAVVFSSFLSLVRDCAKFQMPMILNSYVTTGVVFHQTLTHHPRIPMYAYGIATGGKIVFWGIWAGRGFKAVAIKTQTS